MAGDDYRQRVLALAEKIGETCDGQDNMLIVNALLFMMTAVLSDLSPDRRRDIGQQITDTYVPYVLRECGRTGGGRRGTRV
jgi:hypothetical protein